MCREWYKQKTWPERLQLYDVLTFIEHVTYCTARLGTCASVVKWLKGWTRSGEIQVQLLRSPWNLLRDFTPLSLLTGMLWGQKVWGGGDHVWGSEILCRKCRIKMSRFLCLLINSIYVKVKCSMSIIAVIVRWEWWRESGIIFCVLKTGVGRNSEQIMTCLRCRWWLKWEQNWALFGSQTLAIVLCWLFLY